MQQPQQSQRAAGCNGLRGQGPRPCPELWGLLHPHGPRRATGKEAEVEFEVCAPRPAPALARAQRPRPYAGPIAHACAALRPHSTLPLPSPPLPR